MRRAKKLNLENIKEYIQNNKKKSVIIAIGIIILLFILIKIISGGAKTKPTMANQPDRVTRGDISVTITASASVEPFERFEIIPKVSGDIIYCPFNVGDTVKEGDLLYGFDTSSSDLTVERQKISLKQSERSYQDALEETEKLYIKAKNDGVICDLSIQNGQEISNGTKIASIKNTKVLEVTLPFTQAQINMISVGDSAQITSSQHMSSASGRVIHKASASYAGEDGSSLFDVTVSFDNPGAFYEGMQVGGMVAGEISPGSGTIKNSSSIQVSSETAGTVNAIFYKNGDYVKAGTVIATLTSDSITDKIEDSQLSYKSATLSMQQTQKDLEDYNITSPINGTVITKNSKAGDTIDKTNSQTTMMVVADISKLKFNLSIDELDISSVKEGQEVSITCDALPDEKFSGIITTVSVEGSAENGVTTYLAEVVIDQPGNLRPSMNIDASIIIESANDVLLVPTQDVKTFADKSFVFVRDDGKVDKKKLQQKKTKTDEKANIPDQNSSFADKKGKANQKGSDKNAGFSLPEAPDGYKTVEIITGISNEDYTEVISGLSEGDEIYSQTSLSGNTSGYMSQNMGGMPGNMSGRGMPGAMPGGGMPGGGMR